MRLLFSGFHFLNVNVPSVHLLQLYTQWFWHADASWTSHDAQSAHLLNKRSFRGPCGRVLAGWMRCWISLVLWLLIDPPIVWLHIIPIILYPKRRFPRVISSLMKSREVNPVFRVTWRLYCSAWCLQGRCEIFKEKRNVSISRFSFFFFIFSFLFFLKVTFSCLL